MDEIGSLVRYLSNAYAIILTKGPNYADIDIMVAIIEKFNVTTCTSPLSCSDCTYEALGPVLLFICTQTISVSISSKQETFGRQPCVIRVVVPPVPTHQEEVFACPQ